ncbi:hypothetical protein [Alicyclobacillus fodiniaquatilis]|jgi:hypothetical protein|uniref:Helix-turn-helix domain-containing protein n=1 Tax=Alicyclobacillus fodiniaquatilis TaxID=1661150 RepID=A0ABW4JAS9_9BACL
MTTRFSLAELADMLHVSVEAVRNAVEAQRDELSGESFIYNERTWRIAPSDVLPIKTWLEAHPEAISQSAGAKARRVRVKRIAEEQAGE